MGLTIPNLPSTEALRLRTSVRADRPRRAAVASPDGASRAQAPALRLGVGAKYALDAVIAVVLLAVFALPMLVIAVLVKQSSPGPVLYRQRRVGLNGRTFELLKFRTMYVDAEAQTGPVWARERDPRCTPLGGRLRSTSLDELPQLINVLRGEMSLVGPRPERPFFVEKFSRELRDYPQRHTVLPGLTGWAQVRGWRGDTSIEHRLEHDLHYVRNRSLWLDLKILAVTPWVMFRGSNAY